MLLYDPFLHAVQRDPYPVYAALREREPVHHNAERDFYALTRHADVRAALRDPELYSSSHGDSLERDVWGPQARELMSFIAMDAPDHTRVRALVSKGFTPRMVAALEPEVRSMTRRLLAPHLEGGAFDFVAAIADIPVHVVASLIGIPEHDRGELLRMSSLMLDHGDESGLMPEEFWASAGVVIDYFKQLIAERRREPREDLATVMAHSGLSDDEIVAVIGVINVAGNESTTKLIANAWYQAALHPDQRELAWGGRVREWVEETLRFDASAQAVARRLTRPAVLHGVQIPEGARMWLVMAAANRDERAFPHADRYDLTRDTSAALAFGTGPHFCLGAALARQTTTVVLSELIAAVETYTVEADSATYVRSPNIRGFATLPTAVVLRSRRG